MPELPEVETVRQTLRRKIINKQIKDVTILYDKLIKSDLELFKKKLINQTFKEIERYGKYLLFKLDDHYLISHLRMEGKYFLKNVGEAYDKHDHVIFTFTDHTELRYNDVRKFGTMELKLPSQLYKGEPLEKLGLEPFSADFTFAYLKEKLSNKKPIKNSLLDQTIIAGLGNIYVNEILFLAKIHPETLSHKLSDEDIKILIEETKKVIIKAITLGGTTIRSYYSDEGITGKFQNQLVIHSRKGEKCINCGDTIIKTKVSGRGTYICPTCQVDK